MKNTAASIIVGALALLVGSSYADYTLTVATADATKGSVTAAGGTYPEGTAVTITATPESGYTFTRWDGVHPSLRLDNPLVLPVTNNTTATAVFGKTYYVATDGSDSTADGTNPATPYKTIEKAATAADDGDTVLVGEGNFTGSANLTLAKAVVLRGAGMDKTARLEKQTILENINAIVADMRFSGFNLNTMYIKKGNLLHCDVSKNSSTTTDGVGIRLTTGSVVGCVVTNNANNKGGNGVGILVWTTGGVAMTGPALIEDCLVADNSTGYAGTSGGIAVALSSRINGNSVTLRHCTVVRNAGGEGSSACGGLYIGGGEYKLIVEGCLIGGNTKFSDETAGGTDDAVLGLGSNAQGLRVFRDTVIARMATPARPAYFTFENCVTNVPAGFTDLAGGDFTVTRRSPAWGLCADGSDAGCFQSPRDGSFDVGCYPLTNAVCDRLETVLVARAENAPDATVTFDWDLDGDGNFEASGETVPALYDEPGLHAVTVRAISGGQTVTRTVPNLVYVAPREIFAWPASPSPTFPYATWETAAHTVNEAVAAAENGCRVQLTNAFYQVAASVRVCRTIEIAGTGTANNSVKGQAGSTESLNRIDANATGTCVQEKSSSANTVPFRLYRSGILLHSMAIGPGNTGVVGLYENAIVSNCVIRSGHYSQIDGVGLYARAGLVTHCVISNNYTSSAGSGGSVSLIQGGATLRNSLVCKGRHPSTNSSKAALGTVYAAGGCTVENCTIVANTATTGGGLYTSGEAVVRNNIIRDNQSTLSADDWYDATGSALYANNCLTSAHGANDGTVTNAPLFLDPARRDYRLHRKSPARDQGILLDWMDGSTRDLDGNPRVRGGLPDIGCYEFSGTDPLILFAK